MTARSLSTRGLRHTRAGAALCGRAIRDAGHGLRLILIGLVLLLAGRLVRLREQMRLLRCPRGQVLLRWAACGLVAMLAAAGIWAGAGLLGFIAGSRPDDMWVPAGLLAYLGVLSAAAVGVFLAARLLVTALAASGAFLLRSGGRVLTGIAVCVLVCGLGVVLYLGLQPAVLDTVVDGLILTAGEALAAGLAVLAVVAVLSVVSVIAVIAVGPSVVSVFQLGGRGAAGGDAWEMPASPPVRSDQRRQPLLRRRAAVIAPCAAPPPDVPAGASQADPLRAGRSSPSRRQRRGWVAPYLCAGLALSLAWLGGGFLVRAVWGNSGPGAPVAAPPPPRVPPKPVQLLADGAAADLTWRSGYRDRTARLDTGAAIGAPGLPAAACEAAIIVVFGSASSDGAAARNDALARHRARWLGAWTQEQLAQCPRTPPLVLALSLGQARSTPSRASQRALRLLQLGKEDLAGLASSGTAAVSLRRLAEEAFGDLSDFERFEACALPPAARSAAAPAVFGGLPDVCSREAQ